MYYFAVPTTWFNIKDMSPEKQFLMSHVTGTSIYFQVKSHEWHTSETQRNSSFHCGILRLAPTGISGGLRHKLTDARPIYWDWSTHLSNTEIAAPGNLISYLSRVTQQAHIRPLHFLCGVSFPWPWGCEVSVSLCDGLCAKTQKRVTSCDMNTDLRALSVLDSTGGSTVLLSS